MDDDSVEIVDIGLADLSWAEFIRSRALYSFTSSSTAERLDFLNHSLLPRIKAGDLSDKTLGSLLHLVFLTYSRYNDRPSRLTMINVLKELNNWDSDQFLRSFVPLVTKEADKLYQRSPDGTTYTTSSASRFVLFTWVNLLITFALSKKSPEDSPHWKKLVDAQAMLLHSLVSENEKRKNIKRSALVDVRRSIRNNASHIPSYISYLISNAKACNPIYRNAILLGTIIDCSLRLRKNIGKSYVVNAKDDIIQYYITAIVSSKTSVSKISADALHDFMNVIVTEEDFRTKITPVLEKQLLRAPEILLNVLISLFKSVSFDVSKVFKDNFLQSLLVHIRSTNKIIQMDAAELLNILIKKSSKEEVIIDIVKDILQTLTGGKVSNPEHRIILLQALAHVHQSPNVVKTVIDGILPIVSKESNETSLAKATDTLGLYTGLLLKSEQDISVVEKVIKSIVDGLSSSKAGTRKAWAITIGQMVWEETGSPSNSLKNITQMSLTPLVSTLEKIQSNPLTFIGGPIEGYITIAIAIGRGKNWNDDRINNLIGTKKLAQNILITSPKPSFLLWDKVYSKLSTFEEGFWFVRALEGVLLDKDEALLRNNDAQVFLSTAFIYLTTSSNHRIRREAYDSLKRCTQNNVEIVGEIFRKGLTQWVLNLEKNVKDSTAVLASSGSAHSDPIVNAYRLSQVLTAITTFSKEEDKHKIESSLVELIILAHHPLIVSPNNKYNWITLVQRAQLNPGKLVENDSGRLRQIIQEKVDIDYESKYFYKAAMSAIATITFISPETTISLFLSQCHRDLDASLFENIGEKEIEIWKTEEGTLFVDVLKRNKKNIVENRNRKDYQTEKWERELRESIAKKKGEQTPKLTKEEQAAVDAQLAKESEIRKSVKRARSKLTRGLDIIDALVEGNSEAIEKHVVEFMRLLNVVVQKGGPLVGDKAINTYLRINRCTSEKIENIRDLVGLATLRAMNVQEIPERWLQEPLGLLVTRVLYRLRFITERSILPPSSFAYCFPLIHQVIKKGGFGYESEGEKDIESLMDQIALGLDIIFFHSTIGSSTLLPRTEMIQVLLQIIKEHPKFNKLARTALINLCEAIGETVERKEIDTLLNGLLSSELFVRHASLQALDYLDLTEIDFACELWVACHDEDENNAKLALTLWEDNGMDVEPCYALELLPLLIHDEKYVQVAASKAIGNAAKYFQGSMADTLNLIYDLYKEKASPNKPEYDEFGMVKPESLNKKDPWEARVGLALALGALAPSMRSSDLIPFFEFLINDEAVGDIHAQVRQRMLEAGLAVIDVHGAKNVTLLLPVLENYLDKPAAPTETHDRIRESVVIWFGALARHLNPTDARIPVVIDKLLETLKTPAEAVQAAVGDCLPPLIKSVKDNAPNLIEGLLNQLFRSEKYAERRGAAFGLAGVVKGTGISALKDCNVMTALKEGVDNKKDYKCRQGALFAFETLSQALGRLFEPYIIQILPLLLVCFGDTNLDVREATSDAARVIMSKISGHCVKLILPSLLAGLDDRQWRTKKGSVELLGAMAFCAPKQLSISLPTIVPRLTNVLTDSHTNVQSAANEALLRFGEVISNPEIQSLVPILLKGLSDPDKHTNAALDSLLETAFVHYIDAPSLALVMPILERGLRERGTEIKKKSSQIVGNMASLTDVRDIIPYLPRLLPGLKEVLVDPVPEARATAAKALGTMVEKLGEDKFPNLVNELVYTLKSDTSGVDRQGAAQGLSEVLAGLGLERLDGLLPEIINNTNSSKSYVREGFISLLIYLPATFGLRFQPYLGRIIPPILSGLADESEYVRDASLRAGQMIVANYATKAVDLLLPELERGLFDNNWRIRQSSVQLMGDLLYRITGISGKAEVEGDEDDAGGTEAGRKALLQILGKERRDRLLAALYIVRQDVSGIVRQASIHVWKVIVSNTPRTVKEILPIMMGMIIRSLASPSYERRQVAGRTLGELVRKLGESVLSEIMPILEEGLESQESDMRQGVCIGLSEIMSTAGKVQVIDYVDSIIPAVRKALVDESSDVREAAAQAFDTLQQNVGDKAIDEILPTLLNSLQSGDESSYALEALKEIMAVRANVVFPVLIPTLIQTPITAFNARALASLVTVAGPVLNKRLTQILIALMISLGTETDEHTISELKETKRALLLSIDNVEGLQTLMTMLFEAVKNDDPSRRAGACDIVTTFCSESKMDYSRYVTEWIRVLVLLLDDRQNSVVKASWDALMAVVKPLKKDELEQLVIPVRRAVKGVGIPGVDLPGFCLPKGISPILPIFSQGLMYGTAEIREQSALGIGDLIQRTSAEALRPFVTQITGPLIRIIGDRYPPQVKAAILHTLSLLLSKVPAHLKPFIPQLQRTFIKSLSDPSSALVRSRAASALGILISLQTRVDPLIIELVTGIKTSEPNVRETMLSALESVINKAGAGMNDTSKKSVIKVIVDGLSDNSDGMVVGASRLFGSLCKHVTPQEAMPIISTHILSGDSPSQSSLLAINAILVDSSRMFYDLGNTHEVVDIISKGSTSKSPNIADTAIIAAGKMLLIDLYHEGSTVACLVEALATNVREPATLSGETKRLALTVFRAVGKKSPQILEPHLSKIVPHMMVCVRDRSVPVKLAAELALVYVLQLLEGETMLQKYLSTVDATMVKSITELHKRTLTKLVVQEQQKMEHIQVGVTSDVDEDEQEIWAVGNIGTFASNIDQE